LSLADSYYVDEDYELAIDAYAAALACNDESGIFQVRALSHRSAAFYHLGRYQEARNDAQEALACPTQLGLWAGETELCHKRLGLACLELHEYAEAKREMEQAAQLATLNGKDAAKYQQWIGQCEKHLTPKPASTATAATQAPPPSPNRRPTMPKYQYYQSDTIMTIAILEPGVQQEDLRVTFGRKKLTVTLRKGGVDFTVLHGTLYETVDIDCCKVRLLDEKVLIKLRKQNAHEWHELMGKGNPDEEEDNTVTRVAADAEVPTVDKNKPRAYASHRDWDAIERNLELQEKKETPEGEDAMNKLFQDIYSKADEDTRRAMVKSFQTSRGTVLSTNWNKVSKKNYEEERVAPQGMEWKNWEGEKLNQKEDDDE
jgi:suppressor of G2 allele of SKP1